MPGTTVQLFRRLENIAQVAMAFCHTSMESLKRALTAEQHHHWVGCLAAEDQERKDREGGQGVVIAAERISMPVQPLAQRGQHGVQETCDCRADQVLWRGSR